MPFFAFTLIGLGLLFIARRAPESRITVPVPAGWQRMSGDAVTPELASISRSIINVHASDPYGTLVPIDAAHAALIDQHFHPPGGPLKPWGFHHGVSLLERSA